MARFLGTAGPVDANRPSLGTSVVVRSSLQLMSPAGMERRSTMKRETGKPGRSRARGIVASIFLSLAAAGMLLALNAGPPAVAVVGIVVLLWALVQEQKMRRTEASTQPVSPEALEAAGLGPSPGTATAKDLYLDTMKRALMNIIYHESSAPMWCTSAETGRCGPIDAMDLDRRLQGADFSWNALTLLGHKRLDNLQYCVESVLEQDVPGDFLEAGAFKGGGCIYMKAVLRANELEHRGEGIEDRRIFVCDTFVAQPRPKHLPGWLVDQFVLWVMTALLSIPVEAWRRKLVNACARLQGSFPPSDDPSDHSIDVVSTIIRHLWKFSPIGGMAMGGTGLINVRSHFARFGLLDERVQFLQGFFSEILPSAPIDALAILRVDCDTYESVLDALRPLYHKLSDGGFCIIDDYFEYPDCQRAVQIFREEQGIQEPIHRIDWNGAYWIKGESVSEATS